MLKLNLFRLFAIIFAASMCYTPKVEACTGISFTAKDGSKVIGRTMEWGTFPLDSRLVLVPRGHTQLAVTPTGKNGMRLTAKYGYAGIGVLEENFIAEGMNEKGLVGELFYFPGYGECQEYDPQKNAVSINDAQFLAWVLGNFATVDEMKQNIHKIRLITYGHGFQSTHFNIGDATGHQVVVEFYDGRFHIFENKIGVITNAPSFDWHMTNLNNYVNVFAGMRESREIAPGVSINSFGVGSSSFGLPGDLTPPSRFVRAAFYAHTAVQQPVGHKAVMQIFQILNNFDVPVGAEFDKREEMPDMLSATQWTAVSDTKALKFYYKTEWNYSIRCIDLKAIDFGKAKYQVLPLDKVKEQPVEYVRFK